MADLWMTFQVNSSGLLSHFKVHSNRTALARQLGGGDPMACAQGACGMAACPRPGFPPGCEPSSGLWEHPSGNREMDTILACVEEGLLLDLEE